MPIRDRYAQQFAVADSTLPVFCKVVYWDLNRVVQFKGSYLVTSGVQAVCSEQGQTLLQSAHVPWPSHNHSKVQTPAS